MTDVPSSQAVAVRLGPSEGMSPVVFFVQNAAEELPRELREQFFHHLEARMPEQAEELMDPGAYHDTNQDTLAAMKFAPGTPAHVALQLARRASNWFFEDLAPRAYRRTTRYMKQLRRKQKRKYLRGQDRIQCRHPQAAY